MSLTPRRKLFPTTSRGGDLFNIDQFFNAVENDLEVLSSYPTGLSISSDDKSIYVEAHVPGLTSKDVDVSIDNNVLWIKGAKHEEEQDKKKKYYRQSQSSFSYCIPLWDDVDTNIEPEATVKDGLMRIIFSKKKEKQVQSKKIRVKE